MTKRVWCKNPICNGEMKTITVNLHRNIPVERELAVRVASEEHDRVLFWFSRSRPNETPSGSSVARPITQVSNYYNITIEYMQLWNCNIQITNFKTSFFWLLFCLCLCLLINRITRSFTFFFFFCFHFISASSFKSPYFMHGTYLELFHTYSMPL